MLSLIRNALFSVSRRAHVPLTASVSFYHLLSKPSVVNVPQFGLLTPLTPSVLPSCGFKVMGKVRKRCKDCYFVRREERLYIICKTHPRHKQMSIVKKPKHTWILSHATQSKVRPW